MTQTHVKTPIAKRNPSDPTGRGLSFAGVNRQRPAAPFDGGLVF